MAQGITDFTEYSVGLQPNDWTLGGNGNMTATVENVLGATGGRALRLTPNDRWRGISWDAAGVSADAEVAMRMRVTQQLRGFGQPTGAWLRSNGQITPYFQSYQYGYRGNTDTQVIGLDTSTTLTETSATAIPLNTWYQIRGRANGISHFFWQWDDGAPPKESGSPSDLSVNDSTYANAGPLGIGVDRDNGGTQIEIDWFSYGTDGDAAPLPEEIPESKTSSFSKLGINIGISI